MKKKKGVLVIVSGPSGSGKGTVVAELVKEDSFCLSISATTRKPRNYENDGEHYFFKSEDEFKKMISNNELLEWANFCGNYYGTPISYVTKKLEEGKNVILEIEVIGALKVKEIYDDCILIFLMPPNITELTRRLTNRGTEDEETIKKRINRAVEEIEIAKKYDYVVVNEVVEQAKTDIKTIVSAELMRFHRSKETIDLFTYKGEK